MKFPGKGAVNAWQVLATLAACVALAGLAFALGRLTADDPADRVVVGSSSGPTVDALEAISSSDGSAASEALADGDLANALSLVDLDRIAFDPGTATLTATGTDAVLELAGPLTSHPAVPIVVAVSTTTEATPDANRALSSQQADAVVTALVTAGVEPDRLLAIGRGGGSPITATGRGVVRFASEDPALAAALDELDPSAITLDESLQLVDGADPVLDELVALLASSPDARLQVLGYADLDDERASHDRSHAIGDRVAERLVAAGIDRARIGVTGLSDTPVPVERGVEVTLDVGPAALLARSLHDVDMARIRFEPGTATLTGDARAALADVATALALDATHRIEIRANAYTERTSVANHDLSHRQGEAVIDALAELGVDRSRLELVASGDATGSPIDGRGSAISFAPLD